MRDYETQIWLYSFWTQNCIH